jgi:hypothetical protein
MTRPVAELVEGLRADYCNCHTYYSDRGLTDPTCDSCDTHEERNELAAALERLEAENQRLRVTIARPLVCEHGTHWMHWCGQCENAAIDAARGSTPEQTDHEGRPMTYWGGKK